MPFIVTQTSSGSTSYGTTTTVQSVVNAVSQDVRSQLASTGSDASIILDYVNRVQKRILRDQRHPFLLSAPKRFVTQKGISDYWVGPSASLPAGAFDTGLNLSDVGIIKKDEFWDRSNNRKLAETTAQPLGEGFEYRDATVRTGVSVRWKQSLTSPNLVSIYCAPDNQNLYYPVPQNPLCTTVVSGALSGRTYFVRLSFVDSAGNESAAGDTTRIYIPANSLLKVRAPQPNPSTLASGITISNYKVYASTTENFETLQSTSVSTGSDWTEPGTGLVSGAAYPTTNSIEPVRGYVMEFRYYKQRQNVTSLSDILQIPDDYFDIVVAGVNAMALLFLRRVSEANIWQQQFQDGLRQIVRDKNLFPRSNASFIGPDSMSNANF